MIKRRAAFAAILVLGAVLSLTDVTGVNAQTFYYRLPYGAAYVAPRYVVDGLPPHQIMRAVRGAGYVPLSAPIRRGSTYLVIADAPGRGPVRVSVNAYGGEIVSVTSATVIRPDGLPGVAQDPILPRNGAVVRAPQDPAVSSGGSGPQSYNRPDTTASVTPNVPPRDGSTARLANAPTAP